MIFPLSGVNNYDRIYYVTKLRSHRACHSVRSIAIVKVGEKSVKVVVK